MYASEYSYLWLVQAHEKEMTVKLERRRIALEREQEELERTGSTVRTTWLSRALRPVRGQSRAAASVRTAPHS